MIRRFNRYELKYLVDARLRDALVPVMLQHMRPDREGDHGVYEVASLYYDSADLACYRAKIDGINYRRKLRIRSYGFTGDAPDPRVMVEIKQRINRTTQKRRLATAWSVSQQLVDGRRPDDAGLDDEDRATAEEVLFLAGSLQLGPRCVISYRRTALMGSVYEPGLRITFDERLEVSDASDGLRGGAPRQLFLPRDQLILEVKTNDVVPLWVARLLAAHSVRVIRFSKYCAGLEHLRVARQRGGRHG